MTYVCEGDPSKTVVVLVERCTDVPLSEAAAFIGKEIEWPEAILLEGMREHYPEFELTDIVQIVEHLTPAETRQRKNSKLQKHGNRGVIRHA